MLHLQKYIDNKLQKPTNCPLSITDLQRLAKLINNDIFTKKCKPINKKTFSLNNKMKIISRILYLNFIGPLTNVDRVMHLCKNKKCVTIDHLYKVVPVKKTSEPIEVTIALNDGTEPKDKFIIRFD